MIKDKSIKSFILQSGVIASQRIFLYEKPDSMFTLNALKTVIESDDFHDYAMLIGAPRHDGYRQLSTTWLKNSICEFDSMRSCDIIEYVFSRNNYDKSRHADLHEFNSCDIIELVE